LSFSNVVSNSLYVLSISLKDETQAFKPQEYPIIFYCHSGQICECWERVLSWMVKNNDVSVTEALEILFQAHLGIDIPNCSKISLKKTITSLEKLITALNEWLFPALRKLHLISKSWKDNRMELLRSVLFLNEDELNMPMEDYDFFLRISFTNNAPVVVCQYLRHVWRKAAVSDEEAKKQEFFGRNGLRRWIYVDEKGQLNKKTISLNSKLQLTKYKRIQALDDDNNIPAH